MHWHQLFKVFASWRLQKNMNDVVKNNPWSWSTQLRVRWETCRVCFYSSLLPWNEATSSVGWKLLLNQSSSSIQCESQCLNCLYLHANAHMWWYKKRRFKNLMVQKMHLCSYHLVCCWILLPPCCYTTLEKTFHMLYMHY